MCSGQDEGIFHRVDYFDEVYQTEERFPFLLDFDYAVKGFSQSHLTTLASLNHPKNDISFVMELITKADHRQLLQAGNIAYSTLYDMFNRQKVELDAIKKNSIAFEMQTVQANSQHGNKTGEQPALESIQWPAANRQNRDMDEVRIETMSHDQTHLHRRYPTSPLPLRQFATASLSEPVNAPSASSAHRSRVDGLAQSTAPPTAAESLSRFGVEHISFQTAFQDIFSKPTSFQDSSRVPGAPMGSKDVPTALEGSSDMHNPSQEASTIIGVVTREALRSELSNIFESTQSISSERMSSVKSSTDGTFPQPSSLPMTPFPSILSQPNEQMTSISQSVPTSMSSGSSFTNHSMTAIPSDAQHVTNSPSDGSKHEMFRKAEPLRSTRSSSSNKENAIPRAGGKRRPKTSLPVFRPNKKSTSARNLYGSDYVESHGKIYITELNQLWANLDLWTKTMYEQRSQELKAKTRSIRSSKVQNSRTA